MSAAVTDGHLFALSVLVVLTVCLLEMQVQLRHLVDQLLLPQRVLMYNEQHVVDVFLSRVHTALT